jgi:ABC-type polysaccharide/polyol phosphate transport system ATPase subunit
MSDTVIRVESLGKRYLIDHQQQEGYRSLRDVLANTAKDITQRFNSKSKIQNPKSEEFWALKDVSFEVNRGDRIGIIGRNGAGKSTLLKILSRITEPTEGRISLKGRVASLLEVGTGFHPELTGRENIYLNGAILGMSKVEIRRKFDEIVAFAEIEKFLDTPVKRYSSGMYVRLAFAVAAHLEPEILIVDEVLAVGDAQFQRKCLGKMEEVGREGRTILFVSHSMQAISQLTNRCILLNKGGIQFDGRTDQAAMLYLQTDREHLEQPAYYEAPPKKRGNYIAWARIHTSDVNGLHRWGEPISFEFALCVNHPQSGMCFSFQIMNSLQQPICHYWIFDSQIQFGRDSRLHILRCQVPKSRLYMGSYTLTTWLTERRGNTLSENLLNICSFEVTMQGYERAEYPWRPNDCTYLEDVIWQPVLHSDGLLESKRLST